MLLGILPSEYLLLIVPWKIALINLGEAVLAV